MNEPVISLLDSEHLDSVTPLFEAQLREHGIPTSTNALIAVMRSVLSHPSHGFLLSVTFEDSPIGAAYAACILSLEHGGYSGWLEEIYVLPEWRSRGIGSRLLAEVLSIAEQRGWQAMDLEVDSSHTRVMSLYARSHFEPVARTRFVRRLSN